MSGYHGHNRMQRSRSCDLNMTYPSPNRQHDRHPRNNNVFDLSALKFDSPKRYESPVSRDVSMLSPISDRSIEPMSVSDISDKDLDDDVPYPFGNQKRDDNARAKGDGTQWLWSLTANTASTVDDDSVSCVSRRTDRTGRSGSGMPSSALSQSDCQGDQISDSDSDVSNAQSVKSVGLKSVKMLPIKPAKLENNGCFTCTRMFQFLVITVIAASIGYFSQTNMHVALCQQAMKINVTQLNEDLNQNVFGQHIAISTVMASINNLMEQNDKNITVLTFHGWTGIGKNYVSSFIAKHVDESHIHKIIIPMEYAHGLDEASHKNHIFERLTNSVVACALNVFIIDEVDKASKGTIEGICDGLRNLTLSNLERTKTIVLLLSNSGGSAINRFYLDQLSVGRSRGTVTHDEVVDFMLRVDDAQIQHEWHIPLYQDQIIDEIVPFLPLEKSHVSQCANQYIINSRPILGPVDRQDIVHRVLEQMSFFPLGLELFSTTGCRGVAFKVDLIVD